jgi:hypothetical protein
VQIEEVPGFQRKSALLSFADARAIVSQLIARDAWSLKETGFTPETSQSGSFILGHFSLDY